MSARDALECGKLDMCETVFLLVSSRGRVLRLETCQPSSSEVERMCGSPLQTCWLFCVHQPSYRKGRQWTFWRVCHPFTTPIFGLEFVAELQKGFTNFGVCLRQIGEVFKFSVEKRVVSRHHTSQKRPIFEAVESHQRVVEGVEFGMER